MARSVATRAARFHLPARSDSLFSTTLHYEERIFPGSQFILIDRFVCTIFASRRKMQCADSPPSLPQPLPE